jgi:hypothetical protein
MPTTTKAPAAATVTKVLAALTGEPQTAAALSRITNLSATAVRKALVIGAESKAAVQDEATKGWVAGEPVHADQPAAPAVKAAAKPKAAKKAAPKPEKGEDDGLVKGYLKRWPHGAYDLYKRAAATEAEGNPQWVIRCTTHGTTTTADDVKAADALGRRSDRPNWCTGCAKDAKAKAAPAAKAPAKANGQKAAKATAKK